MCGTRIMFNKDNWEKTIPYSSRYSLQKHMFMKVHEKL